MLKFSVPSIIAMMVGTLYNIVDQLFIGNYVGHLGNAATIVAFPFSTSCISLALLFGIGGASCFNLHMGRGEHEKAPFFAGNAVSMLAITGTLLFILTEVFLTPLLILFGARDNVMPYAVEYVSITAIGFPFLIFTTGGCHMIRADGSPRISMACNLIGAVTNIILDAYFVIVLRMGMKGAAFATIFGQFISAVVVFVYLTRFKTVKLTKEHIIPHMQYVLLIASIGMASFFNQLAMMLVQIVLNNSLGKYGAMSVYGDSIPLACAGIVMKVNQIVFSVVIGLAQGTQPIISFNYGAKKFSRVGQAYRLAIIAGSVFAVIAFIMFQTFPREIIGLFGSESEEYFTFGIRFMRIFLFFTWLNSIQPITSTFFTSIGKPLKGMLLSLTRQIIFFLPALLLLPQIFGIDGIIYSGPCADVLSGIVTIIMASLEFKSMRSAVPTATR
ncbi:MAG: MATE family efflux transporter [Oscillospiraceae bacterium]|nr:MATE family efflux transporter [Oscillospiraceae bacterium]